MSEDLRGNDESTKRKAASAVEVPNNYSFWRACAVCLVGAVFFFYLEGRLAGRPSEISLHIATAFLVALILLAALEFKAKRAAHREMVAYREMVAKDVFRAILERMIPAPLFAELVTLMRTEVVKENCRYNITLKKPNGVALRGKMLVERKTAFTARNLASYRTEYVLRSEAPVHLELKVNGQVIDLEEGKNITRVIRNGREEWLLEHRILLEPNGTATIYLAGLETKPIEADVTNYIQSTPVLGLTISVQNEYTEKIENAEVVMIHPAREQLVLDDLGFYRFERAILPGQGFTVNWGLRKEREPISTPGKEEMAESRNGGTMSRVSKSLAVLLLVLLPIAFVAGTFVAKSRTGGAARTLVAASTIIDPFGIDKAILSGDSARVGRP